MALNSEKVQKNQENVRLKIFIHLSHIFMNKCASVQKVDITIITTTIAAIDIDSDGQEMKLDLVEGTPARWRSHQPSRRAPPRHPAKAPLSATSRTSTSFFHRDYCFPIIILFVIVDISPCSPKVPFLVVLVSLLILPSHSFLSFRVL